MRHDLSPRSPREAGSITVFFVLFVLVASAAIAYSLYVGRIVERKVALDNAADTAALSMATNAALGLNMIATNNLATGANLHVAAAIPFIGRYYALIRAITVNAGDTHDDIEVGNLLRGDADATFFAKGFEYTKELSAHFTRTAAGITTINSKLAGNWNMLGLPKGIETLRLNMPGAIGLPMQVSAARRGASLSELYQFRYDALALSSPKTAMCQTVHSSEGISDRDSVARWLGGAVSATVSHTAGDIISGLGVFENVVQTIKDLLKTVSDAVKPVFEAVRLACIGTLNPWCMDKANEMMDNLDTLLDLPVPKFQGCGLEFSGDFGEMFRTYTTDDENKDEKNAIGFVFPNLSPSMLPDYDDSLQFAMAAASPLYLQEELPKTATHGKCPAEWTETINGHQYCSIALDGVNLGAASKTADDSDLDLAGGGVGRAVGTNGGTPGGLRGVWSRTQWAIGQARVEYEPSDGDPSYATVLVFDRRDGRNDGEAAARRRMQLFWPAWKARNATPTVLGTLLKFIGA